MKIIKEGNAEYLSKTSCGVCGCIFEYSEKDMITEISKKDYTQCMQKYVYCPCCGKSRHGMKTTKINERR